MRWIGLETWLGRAKVRSQKRNLGRTGYALHLEKLEDRLTPATVIDNFQINGATLIATGPAPPTVTDFGATADSGSGNILGGFREATVQTLAAPNSSRATTFDTTVAGFASLSTDTQVNGALRLVYDGQSTDGPMGVTAGGLGGINLAATTTSFNVVGSSDLGVTIEITVYSGAGFTPSTLARTLPSDPTGTNPTTLDYPFSSFAGADFSNVGAIVVDVLPLAGTLSADTTLQLFTSTGTPTADLSITKTDNATTYTPGGSTTYTVTATNNGTDAIYGATIVDTLAAAFTGATWSAVYSSGSSGTTNGTGSINISDVNLLPGGTATFTIIASISASATGTLSNTATITAPSGTSDPTPDNNSATDDNAQATDLQITKTDNTTTYTPGGTVAYTITVTNAGSSTVNGATVVDNFPASLSNIAWTVNYVNGSGTGAGTGNINTAVNLLAGGTATFNVTADIAANATGDLVNTATVTAPTGFGDTNTTNNSATDTDASTTGNITGIVFIDANNNGIFDGADTPISGVTMTLGGAGTGTALSNGSGVYTFANLAPGTYTVTQQAQNTAPLTGLLDGQETSDNITPISGSSTTDAITNITVSGGQTIANQNFGELQPASISGTVYVDNNNNGIYDSGVDTPIQGVVVSLGGTNDLGPVAPAAGQTDINGVYTFSGLRPSAGSGYTVTEQPQTDVPLTGLLDNYETSDNVTPLAGSTATDAISTIALSAGQSLANQNFGELEPSSLTGAIFIDSNNNGVFDFATETPISGATVVLSGANDLGAITPITVTTDLAGTFLFSDLRPSGIGGYTITEPQPIGFSDGIDNVGTVSGVPSGTQSATGDPDVISGIVLGANQGGVDYYFGETGNPLVGQVFVDTNQNGTRDADEGPLPDVVILLKDQAGVLLDSTTTDANGIYAFTNVAPGNYVIEEVQPLGYGSTSPNSLTAALGAGGLTDLDFADTLGCIKGVVYIDINNNRVKDAGEPGITGATVNLAGTDINGRPVAQTVVTLPGGAYSFTGLVAGTYSISEPLPTGFLDGLDAIGTINGSAVGTQTSLGNPDVISNILLPAGQTATNYTFGERSPTGAVVAGKVFYDQNKNAVNDATETGIGGVMIELRSATTGALLQTAVTAADGSYFFLGVATGAARILEVQPRGYGSSTANMLSVTVPATGLANQNFGDTLASLSGFAYADLNNNGLKETGETGIAGVTMTLMGIDANFQSVTRTTVTGADGSYTFADLLEDSGAGYTLTEIQPAGLTDGLDTRGTISGVATGSTGTDDFISGITLGAGLAGINYNFGEQIPGGATFVSGVVFVDANGDGLKNNGDTGLANVQIQLVQSAVVVAITTTDAAGVYLFAGIAPGTYDIVEVQPLSYGSSTPDTVTINPGTSGLTQNFGDTLGSLAGTVFSDANNNGVQNTGETGIAGVVVVLTGFDDDGNPVSRAATTAASGTYLFANLPAGTYQLFETQPPNALDGIDTPGTSGGTVIANDTIAGIVFAAAGTATDYNFAERNVAPASLSGAAYVDVNANGLRDNGEPGLGNVLVTLKDDLGAVVATVLTAANGLFSFTGLPALNGYSIEEAQPFGFLDGTDIVGTVANATRGTQSAQGDPDIISGINLLAGNNAVGYLFGELNQAGTGNISGVVFRDTDGNGVQGATEPGQKAITVELLDAGNQIIATTSTSASGTFLFPNLAPGTYTARLLNDTAPTGFGTTTATNSTVIVAAATTSPAAFGLATASLAGFVYNDINVNGTKDTGEPGIPGVLVTLTDNAGNPVIDADGNPVAAVQTASNGSYLFANLLAGTYQVRETQPANIYDGPDTIGTVGGVATGTATNDLFSAIALLGGDTGINYNFGDLPPTDPNGFVFRDRNGNGLFEPALGDLGVNGVSIRVTGFVRDPNDFTSAIPFDETFVTGSDPNLPAGFYVFNPIPVTFPGAPDTISGSNFEGYTIAEITSLAQSPGLTNLQRGLMQNGTPPAGAVLTATRQFANIILNPGALASDFNFAELAPSSLSGIVFLDKNRDGKRQKKERLLGGAVVQLTGTDALGAAVNLSATTTSTGAYTFTGLLPPNTTGYTLTVTPPPNSGLVLGRARFPVIVGAAQQPLAGPGAGRISRILILDGSALTGFNFGLGLPSKRSLTR